MLVEVPPDDSKPLAITTWYEPMGRDELAALIATNSRFVREQIGDHAPATAHLLERNYFPEGPVVYSHLCCTGCK